MKFQRNHLAEKIKNASFYSDVSMFALISTTWNYAPGRRKHFNSSNSQLRERLYGFMVPKEMWVNHGSRIMLKPTLVITEFSEVIYASSIETLSTF